MKLMKFLCSIPVILLLLYFLPPLGVIVFLARYLVYGDRHFFRAPVVIAIVSLILLIPQGLYLANQNFNLNLSVPFLNEVIDSNIYPKLADYAKFSFIVAIIILIVTYLLRSFLGGLSAKFSQLLSSYFSAKQAEEERIAKENDLKLKEKALTSKQKTPHVVKCPHCGKSNSIIGTVGECISCREPIEYKEVKHETHHH